MRKLITCLAAMLFAMTVSAEGSDFFTPYKSISLRAPSVPLFVNDPYVSFWSAYDQLNEGEVSYWYSRNVTKPMRGLLRVDGDIYRFMGAQRDYILGTTLLPMGDAGSWTAPVTFTKQNNLDWTQLDFDDSDWVSKKGPLGSKVDYSSSQSEWSGANTDVYVRRTMTLTAEDLTKDLYVRFSHDDVFEIYINGVRVATRGETWIMGEVERVPDEARAALKVGKNIVAAHCHNTSGGAFIDFGVYANTYEPIANLHTAVQKSVNVLATNTYYTFTCGPVDLDLVFTAPMLIDDLDLLSTPINYVSYQVRSNDGKEHDVQFYIALSPKLSTSNDAQSTTTHTLVADEGYRYLRCGTQSSTPHETGSYDCIDWGYLYLPEINGTISVEDPQILEQQFVSDGTLPAAKSRFRANSSADAPELALVYDLGKVTSAANFCMLGYDEANDIEFLNTRYKGYWAREGKRLTTAFKELEGRYDEIMTRCQELDKRIYDDGLAAGDANYAEILSLCYRQTIAAHKLFLDNDGDLMFFSRENDSGGFINTVDVTYPSTPLFLMYNPELARALITSVYKYCESNRWGFNFANHDLGHYPIANNQHYAIRFPNSSGGFEGNMPIEESGNLLTITATLTLLDGNADYADRFWETITTWADYLVENGQDPENQLCTDDFAGHLAHNANLSIKAIMGVAGYALMAKAKGLDDVYETYMAKAKQMAQIWEQTSVTYDESHYRLTFNGTDDTWSLKYNLVWDKMWQTGIFSNNVYTREVKYYINKMKTYGPPLDNRQDYTKSDWVMWAATLASTNRDFNRFTTRLWSYANRTSSRVPFGDWYYTTNANIVGFRARSVVGGHWMKVLQDNFQNLVNNKTGVGAIETKGAMATPAARYNLNGQQISQPAKGVNIIKYSDGSSRKVVVK